MPRRRFDFDHCWCASWRTWNNERDEIQMIGSKLLEAQGIGEKSIVANAVVANSAEEAIAKAKDGMILVVPTTDKEYMPAIEKAAALSC